MNIVIGPLEAFYIAGSILVIAVAIVAYPTLRDQNKPKKKMVRQ